MNQKELIELFDEEQAALLAFEQLRTDIEKQSGDEDDTIPFHEFLSRMRLLLIDRLVNKEAHSGVMVTGIDDIGHMHVPHLFLASLNEGLIPRLNYRLPFINIE